MAEDAAETPIWSAEKKRISCRGRGLESIPPEWSQLYPDVETIDVAENDIKRVTNLQNFSNLKTLILDSNSLDDDQDFSPLHSLETLWVNKNNISDVERFVSSLCGLEKLTYISLVQNPCWPAEWKGDDAADVQRYRYFVLYKLKRLRFLDSSPVSADEKKEAERRGAFARVARPQETPSPSFSSASLSDGSRTARGDTKPSPSSEGGGENGTVASEEEQRQQEHGEDEVVDGNTASEGLDEMLDGKVDHASYFGYSRYAYSGKQSEGNRFICNNDL